MNIEIKFTDENDGHVRVVCKPPINKLIEVYRQYQAGGNPPPASLVYAVLAIKKAQGDSDMVETEQEREKQNRMQRSGLILPN